VSLKNYIKNKRPVNFTWNGVEIFEKDEILNKDVSLKSVFKKIEFLIPKKFLRNIDSIYIGDFEFLNKKKVHAAYKDGSIFMTNKQPNEETMCSDMMHEFAHSLENEYRDIIYGDGRLEKEFVDKRKDLWLHLKNEGHEYDLDYFLEPEFDTRFDEILYEDIGYPFLTMLTVNLFYSPYGITSLREYFANGFEAFFFHKDLKRLENISKILFDKLKEILYN